MNKRIVQVIAAAGLVLAGSGPLTVHAVPLPPVQPPKHYYLALGDSLAFGYQALTFNQNYPTEPPTAFKTGYVDDFGRMLRHIRPHSRTINYGCTGETTATFITGGCLYTAHGFTLHSSYAGSQLSAALAFLRAHRGHVNPITINLGGNDLNALSARCGSDVVCYHQQGPGVVAEIAANLTEILAALRATAPRSEILTMTNYDVSFLIDPRLKQLNDAFNTAITTTAAAQAVRVADLVPIFNRAPQPATICNLTLICTPLQDVHPSDAGYQVIAQQLWVASGFDQLDDNDDIGSDE